jgi:hypothetical protein
VLLRVKGRHFKLVAAEGLEAKRARAAVVLQCRARLAIASRHVARLVARARDRTLHLATDAARQQLERRPSEPPDATAAHHWLRHSPAYGRSGARSALPTGLAARLLAAQRQSGGVVDLRRTARDPFWLGGGMEAGATGSDPLANRESSAFSPQRRLPTEAAARRVRGGGSSSGGGLLSSGLEAVTFSGSVGAHPPRT